jgi:hypothetical protein
MAAGSRARSPALLLVNALERRLAPLDRAILRVEWRQATGLATHGAASFQRRRLALLAEPGLTEQLRSAMRELALPSDRRRAELLFRTTREVQIEQPSEIVRLRDPLVRRISAFHPRWKGRRSSRGALWEIQRSNPDRAQREAAWRGEESLFRPMEPALAGLVALRNARAREFGFRSFPEYRLAAEGLSVARLRRLMEEATRWVPDEMRRTREEFEDATGERGWYPWDARYAQHLRAPMPKASFPGDSMLPAVLRGVRAWGIPSSLLRFRVDFHDLPAGGISLAPDPPRDVRVVVHPEGGWEPYGILFHEVGHAIASGAVRQPSHLLRWHEHVPGFAAMSEGEGGFFEAIAATETWLQTRPGLSREQVAAAVASVRRSRLHTTAWMVVWISRELALYEDGPRGPEHVAKRLERRLFGYESHAPLSFADGFTVELPLYSPSYFLASLFGSSLRRAVLAEVGGPLWPNRKVGPWLLRHWMREGTSFDWTTRLRELTGAPFDARAFLAETRPGTK